MKLLFDHNISHRLVEQLHDIFPGSTQTRLLNLARGRDSDLWQLAKLRGLVFVTKDRDVAELATLRGAPPKVVWLRMGNCKTKVVEFALRANVEAIRNLIDDPDKVVLEIFA